MTYLQTCRLCGQSNYERGNPWPLIKYGTRHSAHADCALRRWGTSFFGRLTLDQLGRLPFMLLQDLGLMDACRAEMARRKGGAR